jgi:glucosamine--fructose-6-phosphate aminotransferase (isomerizing)
MARQAGAVTVAVVNDPESPLAEICDSVLPILAGPERSVAATKTVVASLAALLRLVAGWTEDERLPAALDALADAVRRGRVGRLGVERVAGEPVVGSEWEPRLLELGFRAGPRKLTLTA